MTDLVAVLHPGEMGAALGATIRAGGATVVWASAGRRPATARRAEAAGLLDRATVAAAVEGAVVVSVCPPASALDVAREVLTTGWSGTYLDANAVAPATARRVAAEVEAGGGVFVDGGIVGPPPHRAGTTRLFLSGSGADAVADVMGKGPLEVVRLDAPVGAASALKAAYAAWTKGGAALLLAIRALARTEGVEEALLAEWARSAPDAVGRSELAAATAPKAWRFVGEMEESASAFAAAGLPPGFSRAAAEVYRAFADLADTTGASLEDILGRLTRR